MQKVSVGITTVVHWTIVAGGLAPIVVKIFQEGEGIKVNGPEKWGALAAIIFGGIAGIGRYVQAALKP